MPEMYFLQTLPDHGACELADAEAHHLLHVMRAAVGDEVQLFDGCGGLGVAVITSLTRRSATLTLRQIQRTPTPPASYTIATAVPKGERAEWMIEKFTELGTPHVALLQFARSVVEPRAHKVDRWRGIAIAAGKQSGRLHLPTLSPCTSLPVLLTQSSGQRVLLADPAATVSLASVLAASTDGGTTIIIGPEGGVTPAEVASIIAAGGQLVALGPHILRTETAAIAAAALASSILA